MGRRRQRFHSGIAGGRCRQETKGEEGGHLVLRRREAQVEQLDQDLGLGSEVDPLGRLGPEQGFFAEGVGDQVQARAVVEGEGVHAVETVERRRTPLPPGGEQDLGVAGGRESVASGLELLPQFHEVVDLAVVGERQARAGQRLSVGLRAVEDGQARVPQIGALLQVHPFAAAIGAAVVEPGGRPAATLEVGARQGPVQQKPEDAAHRAAMPAAEG